MSLVVRWKTMNNVQKCETLKQELRDPPEPQLVPITRFFDGNDDLGSIGCNLIGHPGIDLFRDILVGLLSRHDVEAVYAAISELNPGESQWPFANTVFVFGSISVSELTAIVNQLEPDEVCGAGQIEVPTPVGVRHDSRAITLWWD